MEKYTLITPVLNEEKTIVRLLESIVSQTITPNEMIIVDGGSNDNTVGKIREFIQNNRLSFKMHYFVKKGNRSVGRNAAVDRAKSNIILSCDAGCYLDKDWVKNITRKFNMYKADVVAGYYKGIPANTYQKSLIPYVLVTEDRVDPNNFLPASRSMAFTKNIWRKAGKFTEIYSHNEDYVFAKNLKKIDAKIIFAKDAIIYWMPRENIRDSYFMFYRFAVGDAEAGIFRPKVILVYIRYIIFITLLILLIYTKSLLYFSIFILVMFIYIWWAISKNYKDVDATAALYYLPLLQFISDIAILIGTLKGLYIYLFNKNV